MPRRHDLESICLIGSGPIVIGQACEFDYAGCQALKVLREDGFRTIVVNSNPATIMTDPGFADRTYLEPLDLEGVTDVLARERPDALLPTMGGQTALNLARELALEGVLDELGVELIGAPLDVIQRAEDRELFRMAVREVGLQVPSSRIVTSLDELGGVSLPAVIRPAFTLGGHGGGFVETVDQLYRQVERGLGESPIGQVLVEESVRGWDEFELEVVRDSKDNVVIVCSIENIDPMGVHTGDSVTVAPQMTLSDHAYQELRDAAAAVVRAVGVECGGSNIQFARERDTGELRVIEMNPRVSRSSALASKATGYPIAKVAAKLAVGYTLDEIPNDLTGTTPASFEPTLDYVVVKFPRFAFEKFPGADTTLGTQMKSVGEAMGIGRTFLEAFRKARRSRELDGSETWELAESAHPWFHTELANELGELSLDDLVADDFLRLKRSGWSDAEIATVSSASEDAVRARRRSCGVRPSYRRVDSCAGEVEAASSYYYSTWGEADEAPPHGEKPRVVILGSGPNRIGQGIEFDYCCVHAAQSFRRLGYEAVMVNCNPETVSTDYDTSDRLYFEPLGLEEVLSICERERPEGVAIQFGGQTPLKLARGLEAAGHRIIGTPFDAVDVAEDRERFGALLERLGVRCPEWGIARTEAEARVIAERIGYPILVRPSYVLGGRAMRVCYSAEDLGPIGSPVLIDRFIESAIEIDVDAVSDGRDTYVGAVMQHVEEAGVHSGDSACVLPAPSLAPAQDARDPPDRPHTRASARSRRSDQRTAGGRRRKRLRARGEPARVANRSLRLEGDRRQPRRRGVPGDGRSSAVRTGVVPRTVPRTCLGQGGGPALRQVPRRRSGPRTGDACHRRSDGECSRPAHRLREGRACCGKTATQRRDGIPLRARRRQAGSCQRGGDARRARVQGRRYRGHGPDARRRRSRRRARPKGDRGRNRADGRRPDPSRALQPCRQHAAGIGRAHGRLPHPRGRARGARAVHHDAFRRCCRGACDRERPERGVAVAAGTARTDRA